MQYNPLIIPLLFFSFLGYAQEIVVLKGKIISIEGSPVEGANILIFNSSNDFIKNTTSNTEGIFEFSIENDSKEYKYRISSLGYKISEMTILVPEGVLNNNIEIILEPSVESLNEVLIQTEQSLKIKKDTVVFFADSYRGEGDEVVEDMLRRLPGITVEEDGGISVNGKEINKILIGGVDIFDQKYRIPSKNIDSRDIEQVELLYNYNENSVLKSLYKSDDIALNLEFKENRKGKLYGNVEAGGGYKKKYVGQLTLFKLDSYLNIFAIGNGNNLGHTSNNFQKENLSNRFITGFNLTTSRQLINPSNLQNSFVDGKFNQNTNSAFSSLNIFKPLTKNTSLRFISNYGIDKSEELSSFKQTYFDSQNTTIQQISALKKNFKSFSTEAQLKFSEKEKIHFELKSFIEFNSPHSTLNTINNAMPKNENLDINNITSYNTLISSVKIGEKALDINVFYLYSQNPQIYKISDPQSDQEFSLITQQYENIKNSYGFKSSFISNKGIIDLGYSVKRDRLNTASDIRSAFLGGYSNNLFIARYEAYLEKTWILSLLKKFPISVSGKIIYEKFFLEEPRVDKKEDINSFSLIPNLSFVRATKNLGKFTLGYSYKNNRLESTDVFSNPILINRRNLLIGTGENFFLNSNTYSFLHSKSEFRKQLFYSSSFIYIQNISGIGYFNDLDDNFDFLKKERILGNKTFLGSLKIDKVFSQLKSGISFDYNYLLRQGEASINTEELTFFKNTTHDLSLAYGTFFKGNFNFKIGGSGKLNKLSFQNRNRDIINYSTFLDLEYILKNYFSITLESKQRFSNSKLNDLGFQNLSSLYFTYQVKKNKLNIYGGIENISNESEVVDIFLTPVSRFQRIINIVPTFSYVKIKYRF